MSMSQLVDVQLYRDGEPVGDRYVSEVDTTSAADVHGLFRDALTHAGINVPDGRGTDAYEITVWRRGSDEVILNYTY